MRRVTETSHCEMASVGETPHGGRAAGAGRATLYAPPRLSPEIDSMREVGTSSWFFMPISTAVRTRNSSELMKRSAYEHSGGARIKQGAGSDLGQYWRAFASRFGMPKPVDGLQGLAVGS